MLLSKLQRVFSRDFFRNVVTLLTGTAIGQVAALLALPIVSRLYPTGDIGFVAIYMLVVQVLSVVATGRYELAVLLPDTDKEAYDVAALSVLFAAVFSAFLMVFALVFKTLALSWLSYEGSANLLYFIPLCVFLSALNLTFYYWLNRKKEFKILAYSRALQSVATAVVSIVAGFFCANIYGLFLGFLAGTLLAPFYMIVKSEQTFRHGFTLPPRAYLSGVFVRYINFFLFSMPMALLNSFSVNIISFYLNSYYPMHTLGLYSRANQVVNYPLAYITNSFSAVFFQKLTETERKLQLYVYSWLANLLIATAILLPVALWGDYLFGLFLGSRFTYSGTIAAVLLPMVVVSFAMRNVANVFDFLKKNELLLVWQILYLAGAVWLIRSMQNSELIVMLKWFSAYSAAMYFLLAGIGFVFLRRACRHQIKR